MLDFLVKSTVVLCFGFWFGAGLGMVQSGGVPHIHIQIDWSI